VEYKKLEYNASHEPLKRNLLGRHLSAQQLKARMVTSPGYPLLEKFVEKDIGHGYIQLVRKAQ